jgi:hypothetical protein
MAKTRKAGKKGGSTTALTVPDLRKRFDSIEEIARRNPDDVKGFSAHWKKMFGKSVSDQAARDYLAFVRETKGNQKGGAMPATSAAGAPLDYTLRPGTETPYGNFPPYNVSGLQYQGQDSQLLTKFTTLTPPAGLGSNAYPAAIQSGGRRKTRKGSSPGSRLTRKQKGGALPPLTTAMAEMFSRPAGMNSPPNAAQDAQMLAKGVNSLSSPRPEVPGPFVTGLQTGPIFSENIINRAV